MKRYNQGFGKFGPMEQSNDGQWVTYQDYEALSKRLEQTKELWNNSSSEYNIQVGNAWREVYKAQNELTNWQAFVFCQAIVVGILAILYFFPNPA